MDTYDLTTAEGVRKALAAETLAFLMAGKDGDTNRYRAVVAGLGELLADFQRQAEHDLEGDIAELADRLTAWEREAGNVGE